MTPYTVYLAATGAIIRTGVVRSQDLALQAGPGEAILAGVRGDPVAQSVDITASPPILVTK